MKMMEKKYTIDVPTGSDFKMQKPLGQVKAMTMNTSIHIHNTCIHGHW